MPRPSADLTAVPAIGKVGTAMALYDLGHRLHNQGRSFWRQHFAYSVSVSESDPLYSDVHAWLLTLLPSEKNRNLLVSSGGGRYSFEDELSGSDEPRKPKPLSIKFDDSNERTVMIGGFRILVWLSSPETTTINMGPREPKKIKFQASTYDAQQAVIRELERIHSEKTSDRKPTLKMVSSWGDWQTRSDLPARTMDSVCIEDEQKARIIADLERFLEAEPRYNKLSIPWHRGYMFHGPPGTGKTSLVKALANHFNLDLWYVGLADLSTENSLMSLIGNVGSRSILLLEDIDTIRITNDESEQESGQKITIGSLLNALDGVATPHGLITMMTTNHFDKLDHRLIRAGRMDVVEELSWPTYSTTKAMFEMFYPGFTAWSEEAFNEDKELVGVSPAQISEIFKNNLDDPWAARDQVNDFITEFRARG